MSRRTGKSVVSLEEEKKWDRLLEVMQKSEKDGRESLWYISKMARCGVNGMAMSGESVYTTPDSLGWEKEKDHW